MALELIEYRNYKKWIFFVPHPDDEALGCGGLIALLTKAQVSIHVVLVTNGEAAGGDIEILREKRAAEFYESMKVLGVSSFECWNMPDGKLGSVVSLKEKIFDIIIERKPDIIVSPWFEDEHSDHRAIGLLSREITKKLKTDVLFFEVWGAFKPTHLVDITNVIQVKIAAIKAHLTGISYGNYLNGFIGLSAYRSIYLPYAVTGASYAEAFVLSPFGSGSAKDAAQNSPAAPGAVGVKPGQCGH